MSPIVFEPDAALPVPITLDDGWELVGAAIPSNDDLLGEHCSFSAAPKVNESRFFGSWGAKRAGSRPKAQAGCDISCVRDASVRGRRYVNQLCQQCRCRLCTVCNPPENVWTSPTNGNLHTLTTATQPRFTFAYNALDPDMERMRKKVGTADRPRTACLRGARSLAPHGHLGVPRACAVRAARSLSCAHCLGRALPQLVLEPALTLAWHDATKECCARRGLIVDVGGNFGWYTLYSLALGCE
eukprot:713270-Prymnesium_polylepis.1